MNIEMTFSDLAERREMALIPYLTGGFPTLAESMECLKLVAAEGADLIEVGIPFSDPIADGPTIQHASQTALRGGAGLGAILEALESLDLPCPVVLMSYVNPLLAYGMEKLLEDCVRIGTAGLIIADLPVEEADGWFHACREAGIDLINLIAPTSSHRRMQRIVHCTSGFVYCVSLTGTTGVRNKTSRDVHGFLPRVRRHTSLPTAVGFGVSSADHIRGLYGLADGVVVGSRFIEAVRRRENLGELVRELKQATRESSDVDCHAR